MSRKIRIIPRRVHAAVAPSRWVKLPANPAKPNVQEWKSRADWGVDIYQDEEKPVTRAQVDKRQAFDVRLNFDGSRLEQRLREAQDAIEEFTGHTTSFGRLLRRWGRSIALKFGKRKETSQC